jgi:hypothetical protein
MGPYMELIVPRSFYRVDTGLHAGNILLCGDFNARISYENDFILNDELKFTPIYEDYKTDKNILKTQNRDKKIDQRGKEHLK